MSRKLLVDIAQLIPAHREAIAAAARAHDFECVFASGAEALAAAAEAEVIFGAELALPGAAPKLKWLCVPSAGAEQYLAPGVYASPDAVLTNSSGAYGVTIAEHITMAILMLLRRQLEYTARVADREWERALPIRSIRGSRVTILGTGDIGRETAIRLQSFGPASITGVNRTGRDPGPMFDRALPLAALDSALPQTDILVMALPGTPETAGLMDERRLRLLGAEAVLVNVGRGSAIDQRALERLLRAGELGGAALDVFVKEPIPRSDSIWSCPRLLITTHVAGNMTLGYTVDRIVALFLEDFENYCAGRPLRRAVDPRRGY